MAAKPARKQGKAAGLEARVAAVEQARSAAMIGRDVKALDRLLDDELTYGHSSGDFQSKAQMLARLADPAFKYLFFANITRKVRRRGGVVFSTGKMYAEYQWAGKRPVRRAMIFTAVYQDDESLRLLALHVNGIVND